MNPFRLNSGIEGRHVLMGLIAFFGVMFVANGFLVYYALSTFSGGERPDPYRSGLNYNETIAAAERQDALGWNVDLDYSAGRLTLQFADQATKPVSGLELNGTLARPAQSGKDVSVDFREWTEGVYVADIPIEPGNWVLSVATTALESGAPVYRLKRRLFVSDGS